MPDGESLTFLANFPLHPNSRAFKKLPPVTIRSVDKLQLSYTYTEPGSSRDRLINCIVGTGETPLVGLGKDSPSTEPIRPVAQGGHLWRVIARCPDGGCGPLFHCLVVFFTPPFIFREGFLFVSCFCSDCIFYVARPVRCELYNYAIFLVLFIVSPDEGEVLF